ncbi:MAG: hypothetical protein ACN6NJ_03870 [Acinetobacter sp.]
MKFIQTLSILIWGLAFSGCSYSKENKEFLSSSAQVISQKNVSPCKFDNEKIDFCSLEKLSIYNNRFKDKINFANNKILLIVNEKRDTRRGEARIVKVIVVLDPLEKRVFPASQIVGNFVDDRLREISAEPAKIEYSKNDNKICLSGTTYSSKDNNINVENECYKFENKKFIKIVQPNSSKKEGYSGFNNLPYKSDIHLKCLKYLNDSECNNLNLISTSKLLKNYDFINPQDGDSIILYGNNEFFLIISPFQDESGFNLRIMKVKDNKLIDEKFVYAGKNVEIDKDFHLTYFEGSKKMVINLN